MITALEIENFKAIGSPGIRLDLKPITLLFGPNSAGKSTIIQALQYLRHLVLYETADLDRTDQATGGTDLGGFRRLVHQHDLDRAIRIRVEHSKTTPLEFWLWERFMEARIEFSPQFLSEYTLKDLLSTVALEVEVRWSHLKERPYISVYRSYLNGSVVAEIRGAPQKYSIQLKPYSVEAALDARLKGNEHEEELRQYLQEVDALYGAHAFPERPHPFGQFLNSYGRVIPHPEATEVTWLHDDPNGTGVNLDVDHRSLMQFIAALVIGPSFMTWNDLKDVRHIGALRDIPSRQLQEVGLEEGVSWSRGAAAWNLLLKKDDEFADAVSDWLSGADRLRSGFGLRVSHVMELPRDLTMSRILSGEDYESLDALRSIMQRAPVHKRIVFVQDGTDVELAPSEVGAGLSQLVPVVVAALDVNSGFVAVEQPELHVHPAVQVGLGDLFIHGIKCHFLYDADQPPDPPPIFLIETHSEHLMLRLLRRIEETTEGEVPPHLGPFSPNDLSVNYIHTDTEKRQLKLVRLRIDETGEFIDRWPNGFFDERGDELFR